MRRVGTMRMRRCVTLVRRRKARWWSASRHRCFTGAVCRSGSLAPTRMGKWDGAEGEKSSRSRGRLGTRLPASAVVASCDYSCEATVRAAYSYAMIASVAGERESESAETQSTDPRRRIDCSVFIGRFIITWLYVLMLFYFIKWLKRWYQ